MKLAFIANREMPGLEADAKFAAEQGYETLEFVYDNFWKEDIAKAGEKKAVLDKYGVRMSAIGLWRMNHLDTDMEARKKNHEQLRRIIQFANHLECPVVLTGGGQLETDDLETNAQAFAENLGPIFEYAAGQGVRIATMAFHRGNFFQNLECWEVAWKYLPEVGIKLDPANWVRRSEDNPDVYLNILHKYGDKVYHVHIKEALWCGGKLISQPAAGMGDIHWGGIIALLYEAKYEGSLSMEPHGHIWSRDNMLRREMLVLSHRYISQFIM